MTQEMWDCWLQNEFFYVSDADNMNKYFYNQSL